MRGISRCWQYNGWHVYGAGPCLDKYESALAYRNDYDKCEENRHAKTRFYSGRGDVCECDWKWKV